MERHPCLYLQLTMPINKMTLCPVIHINSKTSPDHLLGDITISVWLTGSYRLINFLTPNSHCNFKLGDNARNESATNVSYTEYKATDKALFLCVYNCGYVVCAPCRWAFHSRSFRVMHIMDRTEHNMYLSQAYIAYHTNAVTKMPGW